MENILTNADENQLRYVVMVSGQEVSPRYATPQAAESMIQHLSEAHQSIAEVVPVTDTGNQLLLG